MDSIMEWCEDQVARQGHAGDEKRINAMKRAYDFALYESVHYNTKSVTFVHILHLGYIVEPESNENGFRSVPVTFSYDPTRYAAPHSEIHRLVVQLCKAQNDISAEQFYREFLRIHPFIDGNGRVASILYHWLNGSLEVPNIVAEPEYLIDQETCKGEDCGYD